MTGRLTSEQARELRAKRTDHNGGRKPRAEEQEIKDALSKSKPLDTVLTKLGESVDKRESWAVSLYLAYMWGKPRERMEMDVNVHDLDRAIERELAAVAAGSQVTVAPSSAGKEPDGGDVPGVHSGG